MLFHRVANTLNYLDIKTVVVSCGTCYDQLQGYEFEKIFPGCRIIDIHEYLLEKGITLDGAAAAATCTTTPATRPMKLQEPMKTVKALVGDERAQERALLRRVAARFGVTRPDIATQVRFRKEEEMRKDEAALRASRRRSAPKGNVKILTCCPSCLQGLSRYSDDLQNGLLEADYIVVEMANQHPRRELDAGVRGSAPTTAASSACWSDEPRQCSMAAPSQLRPLIAQSRSRHGRSRHSDTPHTRLDHGAPAVARAGGRLFRRRRRSAFRSS